jgi:hypothetical protein
MGRGKVTGQAGFGAIFGERRGDPSGPSSQEEDEILGLTKSLRLASWTSLGPAVARLKADGRRRGVHGELAKAVWDLTASAASASRGMALACEHGVFDVTEPMVSRWCGTLLERAANQARFHASQPVGPNTSPVRSPLLEWLHKSGGLEDALGDVVLRQGVSARAKGLIGTEGLDEEAQRDLPREAVCAWAGSFAAASVGWLEREPGDPLMDRLCSESDRDALEEALGHPLPRVVDTIGSDALGERLGRLLVISGHKGGAGDPVVEVRETPHDQELSSALWAPYVAALLGR